MKSLKRWRAQEGASAVRAQDVTGERPERQGRSAARTQKQLQTKTASPESAVREHQILAPELSWSS